MARKSTKIYVNAFAATNGFIGKTKFGAHITTSSKNENSKSVISENDIVMKSFGPFESVKQLEKALEEYLTFKFIELQLHNHKVKIKFI